MNDLSNTPCGDIENGLLNANKIYIVYEFNNYDNNKFIDSGDEFKELNEFVNMITNSFTDKYEQLGILLKINSPGGSALEFQCAYLNLLRLKNKKIELIGLVDKIAASGGYMLASACDKIICSEFATIGSVGVIAQMYNWSELNKKVGLEEKTWTTGSHKNPFPTGTSYTEEDNKRMKEMLDDTFNKFKAIVEKSRSFTPEQLEQIYEAKVFYGTDALKLNMVDHIETSYDYIDKLSISNNVWICKRNTKLKSMFDLLSIQNIVSFGVNLMEIFHNKSTINKKINSVKLL